MNAADPSAIRDILAAELIAEFSELRAIGMRLAREIGNRAEADPEQAATPEVALRFQRIATTVARIGALQLAILEGEGRFAQAAEAAQAARTTRLEAGERRRARAGAMLKKKCVYLFHHEVLQPAADSGGIDEADVESMQRELFEWLFDDRDDATCLSLSTGDIMIGITRRLGLAPSPKHGPREEWEAAVRERWAPYDAQRAAEGTFLPEPPPDRLDLENWNPTAAESPSFGSPADTDDP